MPTTGLAVAFDEVMVLDPEHPTSINSRDELNRDDFVRLPGTNVFVAIWHIGQTNPQTAGRGWFVAAFRLVGGVPIFGTSVNIEPFGASGGNVGDIGALYPLDATRVACYYHRIPNIVSPNGQPKLAVLTVNSDLNISVGTPVDVFPLQPPAGSAYAVGRQSLVQMTTTGEYVLAARFVGAQQQIYARRLTITSSTITLVGSELVVRSFTGAGPEFLNPTGGPAGRKLTDTYAAFTSLYSEQPSIGGIALFGVGYSGSNLQVTRSWTSLDRFTNRNWQFLDALPGADCRFVATGTQSFTPAGVVFKAWRLNSDETLNEGLTYVNSMSGVVSATAVANQGSLVIANVVSNELEMVTIGIGEDRVISEVARSDPYAFILTNSLTTGELVVTPVSTAGGQSAFAFSYGDRLTFPESFVRRIVSGNVVVPPLRWRQRDDCLEPGTARGCACFFIEPFGHICIPPWWIRITSSVQFGGRVGPRNSYL